VFSSSRLAILFFVFEVNDDPCFKYRLCVKVVEEVGDDANAGEINDFVEEDGGGDHVPNSDDILTKNNRKKFVSACDLLSLG